jgi:hypothetical protein
LSTSSNGVPTHYLIVAPRATGQSADGTIFGPNRADPTSLIDGPANTATLDATGNAPAAQFCAALTIGGFTDWYLPALYELGVLYFGLKPGTQNNNTSAGINPNSVPERNAVYTAVGPPRQTVAAQFRNTNPEVFINDIYTSSSQSSNNNVWYVSFASGEQLAASKQSIFSRARAVRRIAL